MRHALVLLSLCAAAGGALLGAQAPARPAAGTAADATAAIRAAQQRVDDEYARAVMSPFTAIAVRYIEPGQTGRLGAGAAGIEFDPAAPMAEAADFTLEADAFWIAPVAGSKPPVIVAKDAHGNPGAGPGTPVKAKTRLREGDVVSIGRYYAEALAVPGAGNVRVFDPAAPAKEAFTGLKWFPPNPALRLQATFTANPKPDKVVVMTSRGLRKEFYRAGTLAFTVDGQPRTLTGLSATPVPGAGDELFVPFRDATTGKETYEVGRYLTVRVEPAGAPLVVDFNEATNPLCNYSPHYNCPIPPRENTLATAIRAGEMTYPSRH